MLVPQFGEVLYHLESRLNYKYVVQIYFGVVCLFDVDFRIEVGMLRYANRNSALFVDTVPDNINIGMCDIGFNGIGLSATFLANRYYLSFNS